jgi:2-oxoacid:acceptor oxidoreductase delta subunit (pyruvate/2-ketoisovalerate family)
VKLRIGGVCAAGGSNNYNTGVWRTFKPVVNQGKCIKCRICESFCPDSCIDVFEDGCHIDYDYCKGCGICSHECPKKAIEMEV